MRISFLKLASVSILMMASLVIPSVAQSDDEPVAEPTVLQGYLFQTGATLESYVITTPEELKAFVGMLPPVIPYKTLPAPPNPDPLRKDFPIDFEESVLTVAVGRNRINRHPAYNGAESFGDGTQEVRFTLSAPTAEAYPFGWAVYSAVVLPRVSGRTTVFVETAPAKRSW